MAINTNSTALHLNLPNSSPSSSSVRAPSLVTVHPSVIASILDSHLSRSNGQPRAIGSLLGIRHSTEPSSSSSGSTSLGSGGEIEIRTSFALPHNETEEEMALDLDYHAKMSGLVGRGMAGREGVVGWFSSTQSMNPYSALIQNFFQTECGTNVPAVYLTVDTVGAEKGTGDVGAGSGGLGIKAWVSQQVGLNPKPENCIFVPVPCQLKYHITEKAGMDLLVPSTAQQSQPSSTSLPPLATLSTSLSILSTQLAQIQQHVSSIQSKPSGPTPEDVEVGKYLLEAVGRWKEDAQAANQGQRKGVTGLDAEIVEDDGEGVKKGLQEVLSVSYLSALLRSQVELGARLNLLT